jgi:esterase
MPALHYQLHLCDEPQSHENPNTPPTWIVLIHGLFGSLDNLSGLRRAFSQSFNILAVDLPDHGQSSHTQKFSFEQYAQLITELMDGLQIKQAMFVGHSLGGKVAMQIALDHSKLVSRLVVIDIAPVTYAPRHAKVIQGLTSVALDTLSSRAEADTTLQDFIPEPSTRQFLLKSLYQQDSKWKWRFNLPILARDYSILSQGLNSPNCFTGPVLFIKGQLSDYLKLEYRPQILALFPNSQSKVVNKTGHWLHAEQPKVCADLIMQFAL